MTNRSKRQHQAQAHSHTGNEKKFLTNKRLFRFTSVLIVLMGVSYLISSFSQSKDIKPKKEIAPIVKEEKKKVPKPVIAMPEIEIGQNPYTFYDQLEKRTFKLFDEDEYGGAKLRDDASTNFRPGLSLTLISSPMEDDNSLSSSPRIGHNTIKNNQNDTVNADTKPIYVSLQTGSFTSQNEANTHRKVLEAYGYKPRVIKTILNNRSVYRVQIGPFSPNEIKGVRVALEKNKIDFFEVK